MLLDENFINAWILTKDATRIANDAEQAPDLRLVAQRLIDAHSYPISSHIFGPGLELRSTFVGNSMFRGARYIDFLDAALGGE